MLSKVGSDSIKLSFPSPEGRGFPVHPTHQRVRASCSRRPVQAGLSGILPFGLCEHLAALAAWRSPTVVPLRGALRPSRAAPGGQPFTEGLSLQRGVHLAQGWFRRNHRTRDQPWILPTFRFLNMQGRGSSPRLKPGDSAATVLLIANMWSFALND